MSRERHDLLIEVSPGETRAAVVNEHGRLLEIHTERLGDGTVTGAICLGRITRIEKAMGAAFIEIGADQPGFLGKLRDATEGEARIVQVIRPAGGGKGPLVNVTPMLGGRYLTLDPTRPGIQVPQWLGGDTAALEAALAALLPEDRGVVARPPATGVDETVLKAEIDRLADLWSTIREQADRVKPPATLLPAPGLIDRLLRDTTGRVVIDEPNAFSRVKAMVGREMPDLVGAIELHRGDAPLFEAAEVEAQLEAALAPTVALPGGGNLVIEQTEALTSIDVNLGGGGGRLTSDAAILKANLAAAEAAARQIMLRNLAGLIVIDFISMRNKGNRRQVVEAMRRTMRGDPVKSDVLGMTPAGLIEITRRRTGPTLAALFARPPSRIAEPLPETLACAALRAVLRHGGAGAVELVAAPTVIEALRDRLAPALEDTGRRLGRPLELRAEAGRDSFEIRSGAGGRRGG